jgi:glyoxylase-like metal-dependent hydrolase (beta-lactamase superfamily II)
MNTPFTRDNTRGHAHAGFAKEVSDSSFCHGPPAELDTATFHPRSWIATDVVRDGSRFTLGGRMLEVLHVPGHAPDALALLDRKRGLLFTGDSYYDGPIWLFGKGTDLAAFEHSITRLVALTPTLTQLLPAHNTANVSPAALSKTLAAIRAVRSGAARATAGDGDQLSFTVDGITILTSRVALRSVHRP